MGSVLDKLFVDVSDHHVVPDNGFGFVQILFLGVVYAYILYFSSNLISDGSELLLLVPSLSGIVGSVVLPILGAIPDAAIVLFSGLGPDAQSQLNVGVGALAGSTIMLLTLPWVIAVIAGRVSLDDKGVANYKGKPKLLPPNSINLFKTGVNCRGSIKKNGVIMALTAIPYVIIQGAAFGANCDEEKDPNCSAGGEKYWALAGMIFCIIAFVGYLIYQVKTSGSEENKDRLDLVRKQAIERSLISLSAAFAQDLLDGVDPNQETALLLAGKSSDRFKQTVRTFFRKYDRDGNGTIDREELKLLLADLGEDLDHDHFQAFMNEMDHDGNGIIDFKEFKNSMVKLVLDRSKENTEPKQIQVSESQENLAKDDGDDDDDDDEEEEEEIPEDLAHLTPEQQQTRIKIRSLWMMALGTTVVFLFSDPMVSIFDEFAKRVGIPAFYVAFILAPLASNAAELLAAYNYALKKTSKTITVSFAALQGVFLALVYFKNLEWEFTAEAISIVTVEILMAVISIKVSHRVFDGILVFMIYPLSLVIVIVLEALGLN